MEIGSFIDIELRTGMEYYAQETDIARLNSGRAAIYHALRVMQCSTVWLPYYQCDTVRAFLLRKNIKIKYYHIDQSFTPIDASPRNEEAILLVNYYGVMSETRMYALSRNYSNVILDHSQAFFAPPIDGVMNVYSARKFVGVCDGAYVIGAHAERFQDTYEQGYSSDTALFLLQRMEYGCEGKVYDARMKNEHRIDAEDIRKMSKFTRSLLDGTDYEQNKRIRRNNFEIACSFFDEMNCLQPRLYFDDSCVPMVYPLLLEDDTVLPRLLEHKHFQGHWWSYLLDEMKPTDFEYYLSRYIIPITIDQRYGEKEIQHIRNLLR